MRNILMVMLLAVATVSASAQIERGFRMGVRVNGGVSMITNEDYYKPTFGYGAGWIAEYNFKPSLFLQSGVGLENIAYKDSYHTQNVFYAQVPVHLGYRFVKDSGKAYFVQAGPTVGVGVWGNAVSLYCETGLPSCGRCDPGNYFEWGGKRFDLGLGGRVGVETGRFQISVGANYGVTESTKYGNHNLTVNLGVGYMF